MSYKVVPILSALILCAYSNVALSDTDPATLHDIHAAAVANPQRTDKDRARDEGRRPAAVLDYFGIAPGMSVLDMFSGGGYYTELLSYCVGSDGLVVSHTNSAYANFVGDEAVNRYANDRLPNVELLLAENNELELPIDKFDAVMMILAYHDIYYVDPDNGWPEINGPQLLDELYASLKPGGILAVVDHYAAAGSPRETGGTLHRIDPAIVRDEIQAAGFVFAGGSDALRNEADDHSLHMGNPEVRGKTDRFVMKFTKPGAR
jgi:predicted methyltransferase